MVRTLPDITCIKAIEVKLTDGYGTHDSFVYPFGYIGRAISWHRKRNMKIIITYICNKSNWKQVVRNFISTSKISPIKWNKRVEIEIEWKESRATLLVNKISKWRLKRLRPMNNNVRKDDNYLCILFNLVFCCCWFRGFGSWWWSEMYFKNVFNCFVLLLLYCMMSHYYNI